MRRSLAYLLVTLGLFSLVLAKFDRHYGFTPLIRFGEGWNGSRHPALRALPLATVPDSNGYDGQFYAQIAIDPLLRSPELAAALDAPAYRARRILLPTVAAVLGSGVPWWVLQTYAVLNVACWAALGWLLHTRIPANPSAFPRWIGCMLGLGVLDSVRQSLVDLPALLMLVLAIDAHTRSRSIRTTVWSALGNLTKETNLLGVLALHFDGQAQRVNWRRLGVTLLLTVLPLALWSLYVEARFGHNSDEVSWGNFTWPVHGIWLQVQSCAENILSGNFDSRFTFGLLGIASLGVQAGFLWRHRAPTSPWWRVGAAYSLLLLFLSSWVWSGYWAACRAALPMTVAFNLLLPNTRSFWPWWIAGNLTVLHALWRFL